MALPQAILTSALQAIHDLSDPIVQLRQQYVQNLQRVSSIADADKNTYAHTILTDQFRRAMADVTAESRLDRCAHAELPPRSL